VVSCRHWWWLRPQLCDEPQYLLEQLSRDGDLGHLEGDPVAHDLSADLDQLFLQGRQRPVLDRLRRRQGARNCRGCRQAHEAGAAPRWRRTFGTTVAST